MRATLCLYVHVANARESCVCACAYVFAQTLLFYQGRHFDIIFHDYPTNPNEAWVLEVGTRLQERLCMQQSQLLIAFAIHNVLLQD